MANSARTPFQSLLGPAYTIPFLLESAKHSAQWWVLVEISGQSDILKKDLSVISMKLYVQIMNMALQRGAALQSLSRGEQTPGFGSVNYRIIRIVDYVVLKRFLKTCAKVVLVSRAFELKS